jgi:hypothetical protein
LICFENLSKYVWKWAFEKQFPRLAPAFSGRLKSTLKLSVCGEARAICCLGRAAVVLFDGHPGVEPHFRLS